jgi:[acyl-carrier-protein] S-malonyltransferase
VSNQVAFVFPGQGSQRRGMLDALPDVAAADRLLDAAEALSGRPLRAIAAGGTADDLADTRAAQPLLYLTDWLWGSALLAAEMHPGAVAGHSLGELAALAIAGVFSVEAGLELVVERARLMARCAQAAPGGMTAVLGLDGADVEAAIAGIDGVWVANDNAPGQVVISGTNGALALAHDALGSAGARKLVPLSVAGPFHSPLMQPAADAFAALLEVASFSDATIPVYQNTDPTPETRAVVLRARLASQISSPVRWTETMHALADAGITTVVEAGPGTVLKGLARRAGSANVFAVEESGVIAIAAEV